MKPQLLPIGATTTTTIATSAAIWHRLDILILATAASTVLWIILWTNHLAGDINNSVGETHAEVHELQRLTGVGKLLKAAGNPIDEELSLPAPHGSIRPIATDIDGETVLAGVDESAHLADVIDLRCALSDNGRAAQ